ncbi:MAG TPA: very short patch repair endonuclease [Chloroflexia bacterium]|jgi:DNA mismatch endonuclease (patch repair protein)
MPDTFSPQKRSEIMRRVKGKNTSLEMKVRSALHRRGLRYRLSYALPGKPDLVFVKAHIAVFIDSCFWHGCSQHVRMPNSNQEYWQVKIRRNVERDAKTNELYKELDWRIIRVWEHELKEDFEGCITRLQQAVREPDKSST